LVDFFLRGVRLHRHHAAKREVVIYDYVDADEPMLATGAAT